MEHSVNIEIALEKLHQLQLEDGDLGANYWYEIATLLKESKSNQTRMLAAEAELRNMRLVIG